MRTKRKLVLSLLFAMCLMAMLPFQSFAAAKASVKLSASSVSVTVGQTKKLTATVTGKKKTVSWKSSNSKVAAVKNGVITAKKAGKATIYAKANGKTAECKVTVKKDTDYKDLYKTFLAKKKVKAGSKSIVPKYFTILNINQEGVPELVVTDDFHTSYVYSVIKGKVTYTGAVAAAYRGGPNMHVTYCPKYKSIMQPEAKLSKGGWGDAHYRLNSSGKKIVLKEHSTFKYSSAPYYIGTTSKEYKNVSKEQMLAFYDEYFGCPYRSHETYKYYENTKKYRINIIK